MHPTLVVMNGNSSTIISSILHTRPFEPISQSFKENDVGTCYTKTFGQQNVNTILSCSKHYDKIVTIIGACGLSWGQLKKGYPKSCLQALALTRSQYEGSPLCFWWTTIMSLSISTIIWKSQRLWASLLSNCWPFSVFPLKISWSISSLFYF